ncbi:HdeD family acid-resistance protein [Flavivirga eckloniae]|uniref:HdeD family acid-resistance protein n=1 Tax=Flavivirga eckloniae TaxID=1803846 RepID=A0A2K9PTV4_9FLAO|nr:DUF308 domain-containing protein [Flavivirga eckloniae]AUP79997.1 hypothetical protein C1H87_15320 [Flavivirga eckloniae]
MKNIEFLKTTKRAIKYWYLVLISGIILISVGFWTLISPLESYQALALLFSIAFILSGISDIIFSISSRNTLDGWGWTLGIGILALIIGVFLLINQDITILTLPFYVSFVLLFRSLWAMGTAMDLKSYRVLDWGYLMVLGVLGMLFSFFLLWHPFFTGVALTIWTGLALIFTGVFSIYLSIKLKKLHKDVIPKTLKKKLEDIQNEVKNTLNKS